LIIQQNKACTWDNLKKEKLKKEFCPAIKISTIIT